MTPRLRDGFLEYAVMELVQATGAGAGYTLREKDLY